MSNLNSHSFSSSQPSVVALSRSLKRHFQHSLDQSVPHTTMRWLLLAGLLFGYGFRVYTLQGFYIVTYGLGIFMLNLLIGFVSPLDEDMLNSGDGPLLPTGDADEFKPFIRRLPEFNFWYTSTKAVLISIFLTFFPFFDIPVFWPILLIYFIILFILTMRRQIQHMIKHKYVPFNLGKKRYSINRKTAEDRRQR